MGAQLGGKPLLDYAAMPDNPTRIAAFLGLMPRFFNRGLLPGNSFFDEMNPGAVAQLRIEVEAVYASAGGMAPAAFMSDPTISSSSAGNPHVGEYSAFTFGTANRSIGARRLFKNGTDFADASLGSIQWMSVGSYFIRVYLAAPNESIYRDSNVVMVIPAEVGALVAPSVSRDPDSSPGTNPPRMLVSWNAGEVNRNTDSIQYQYTQTGTYDSSIQSFPLASDDGINYQDSFKITTASDLAAGAYKSRARIKRNKGDGTFDYSPWSADYQTVLDAPALPPATTTWGTQARLIDGGPFGNPQISSDARTVRLGESKGIAVSTSAKNRTWYGEIIIASMENGATIFNGNLGVVDERQLPMKYFNNNGDNNGQTQHTGWNSPNGEVGYDGGRHPAQKMNYGVGDKIGFKGVPILTSGAQTGTRISMYKNGTLYTAFDTDIIEARITAYSNGDYAQLRFNAGQEPFATADMAQYQWG